MNNGVSINIVTNIHYPKPKVLIAQRNSLSHNTAFYGTDLTVAKLKIRFLYDGMKYPYNDDNKHLNYFYIFSCVSYKREI